MSEEEGCAVGASLWGWARGKAEEVLVASIWRKSCWLWGHRTPGPVSLGMGRHGKQWVMRMVNKMVKGRHRLDKMVKEMDTEMDWAKGNTVWVTERVVS